MLFSFRVTYPCWPHGERASFWSCKMFCARCCREFTGVSQCLPLSAATMSAATLPAFDMYCPISSLPLAFRTTLETIPSASCLPASAAALLETWEARLGSRDRLRVGLAWSGNPNHDNDHNRSLSLRALTSILDLDATFVSLQKDLRPDDRATLLERTEIVDFAGNLTDFAETAALVSCLDLVITVAPASLIWPVRSAGQPGYCCPIRRIIGGYSIATIVPGMPLLRGFSDRASRRDYANVIDRVRTELIAMISGKVRSARAFRYSARQHYSERLTASGLRCCAPGLTRRPVAP